MKIHYYDWYRKGEIGDREWMFLRMSMKCPYCGIELDPINYHPSGEQRDKYHNWINEGRGEINETLSSISPFECSICGWWQVILKNVDHDWPNGWSHGWHTQGILKTTRIDAPNTPLEVLASHLTKNPSDIYHIHYKKMEKLVQSVFQEHFNCEVHHCGQSHDRGIDLLMVESEELIPIQVKRRQSSSKTEGVKVIREMMGVMFRDGFSKAKVVTNASHFSAMAKQEVSELIASGKAKSFDLIDYQKFMSILDNSEISSKTGFLMGIPEILGGFADYGKGLLVEEASNSSIDN